MREGTYHVIEVLIPVLVDLAQYYPVNHFGADAKAYFDEYVASLFRQAYKNLESRGPGTGGTVVSVEAGGEVMNDLEETVAAVVRSLTVAKADFNYDAWSEEWRSD